MVSIRTKEFFSNGWLGLAQLILGLVGYCSQRDLIARIAFPIFIAVYAIFIIYRFLKPNEPWDELTQENYRKAQKLTLVFIELSLILIIISLLVRFKTITVNANYIMCYLGIVKLVQTFSFIYIDIHTSKGDRI